MLRSSACGAHLALRAASLARASFAQLPPACHASRAQRRSPAARGGAAWRLAASAASSDGDEAPLLRGGEARARLHEICQALNLARVFSCDASGPPHAPYFTCSVRVTAATGAGPVRAAGSGGGATRAAAQDAAAAAALAEMGFLASVKPEQREALAWVGDTAFDTLLGLLASRRGLSAAAMDGIRQRLATNASLGGGAPGRALATTVEAEVGAEVLRDAEALRPLLLAAVRRAAPALAAELEAAVASAAPEQP